jgi:hypothetical protein
MWWVLLVLLVMSSDGIDIRHGIEQEPMESQEQPEDAGGSEGALEMEQYPAHSHANAGSRSAALKALSAKKDSLASALRKTDRVLERSRVRLKQVHEADRDHLLIRRKAARELERTQAEVDAAEDRLRNTETLLKSAEARANDLAVGTSNEKARLERVVDDARTRLKRAKERGAEASAAEERAKSTQKASVKTATEAVQSAEYKADALKRKLGSARAAAQSAQMTLNSIQTKAELQVEAENQRFTEQHQALARAENAARNQFDQASEQVTEVNATVASAVKRVQDLKKKTEILKKEAQKIRAKETLQIEAYEHQGQEFDKMQKSNSASSEIDNRRVDQATAQFRLKKRKQQRAQKAADEAAESATITAQLELRSAASKQKLSNAKRTEALNSAESSRLLQQWGSLAAAERNAARVSGQSESLETEAHQAQRAARVVKRQSAQKVYSLQRELKQAKLTVEQATATEEEQKDLLEAGAHKQKRKIARETQRVRSRMADQVNELEDELSAAKHRSKAATARAVSAEQRAVQSEAKARSLEQEDIRLQSEARAEERREIKAAEATERKEEQMLQKEADQKVQDAKEVAQLNIQEEQERQAEARSEAATAKQQLRQAELVKKEELDHAKAQQAAQKRESALRLNEMERLAKERAASALEAAQKLSEQQGGDQDEQAARAAQLQALAEGARAAAKSSQSEYNDAKAEGKAELKAINQEEQEAVTIAEKEEKEADSQATRVMNKQKAVSDGAKASIKKARRDQQKNEKQVEGKLRSEKLKTESQMHQVQASTRSAMDTKSRMLKIKLEVQQSDAAQMRQEANQAKSVADSLSGVVKKTERQLEATRRMANKKIAHVEKNADADRAQVTQALRNALGRLSENVAQSKREYVVAEQAVSTARDAKHAANIALAQASTEFRNARMTARIQHKEEHSLKDRSQDAKTQQQHMKAELRFSQQQINKLSDRAHKIEKEAAVSKAGSDIDIKKATEELNRRNDQVAMSSDVLQIAQKSRIRNQEKRQKEAYESRKAVMNEDVISQAKEKIEVAADKAEQAETELVTTKGLLARSERKLENSKQAVVVASTQVNATAAKLSAYATEFKHQKKARAKSTKDSMVSASAQVADTAETERAAEHGFSVIETHLTGLKDNLEHVTQKTLRPWLLAKEVLKAAEQEEKIAHLESLRRDKRLANFRSAAELQESAAAQAVDSAKDKQQVAVAQLNQANLHKTEAESTSSKATAQSDESHTAANNAVAEFSDLRSLRTTERHKLAQGTEEWANAEKEHWEDARDRISLQIQSQKQAAVEAAKGARKAEADVVEAEAKSHKRIQELKDQHAVLRKELLKQHKVALDSIAKGQKDAIRAAQKVTQAAKNAQSDAELSHQAQASGTDQVIQMASSQVDRAHARTKKRSVRAETRATTAEAAEAHADEKVEVEDAKLVTLREQEAAARQKQEIAEVRQNAAQNALYRAQQAHRVVEQQEAAKVAKAHQSLGKEKEKLGHAKEEVGDSERQLDSVVVQVQNSHLRQQEWSGKADQEEELASVRTQSARQEQAAAVKQARDTAADVEQQQMDEVENTKDILAVQLKIVKASTKAKVDQTQQAGVAKLQQVTASSLGKIRLAQNKQQAAEGKIDDANGALQHAYGISLEAKAEEQGYKLKSEAQLREIDKLAKEINDDKQARIQAIEEAYKEQQAEAQDGVESIENADQH